MSHAEQRFTLEPGRWYAWTMYPGYGGGPYESPIRVESIEPGGQRLFTLRFFNPAYAEGVQDFQNELRTISRQRDFIACEPIDNPGRVVVIHRLFPDWLGRLIPAFNDDPTAGPQAWLTERWS